MIQEVNEPITVLALFEKGAIQPCSITWRNREYQVIKKNNQWSQKVGRALYIHISVETAEATMELVIDPADVSWRLVRVDLEG